MKIQSVKDHTVHPLFAAMRVVSGGTQVSKRQLCLFSLAGCPSWLHLLIMLISSSPYQLSDNTIGFYLRRVEVADQDPASGSL